jgi:hypothetical protein
MAYLTKETLLQKLAPYGVSSWQGVSRLIREQGLPAKYLTPRKPFFDEGEVDVWFSRRASAIVPSDSIRAKTIRRKRKAGKKPSVDGEIKAFKKIEGGAK